MTTQRNLGPFMTLILTLTAKGNGADSVINPSHTAVVNSLMFAQLVIEIVSLKPVGYANPGDREFRLGGLQGCRASSPSFKR